MNTKLDKLLYLSSKFTASTESDDSIYIEGYASTVDRDRQGDVIPMAAWNSGLKNYLKNPIILAYHNHQMPIGKMIEHKVTDQGLWIRAQIPGEVGDVYKLIKKGILSAFSVGFRVRDADYDNATETFLVKELELHEISVVSVPANQNTLFSLAKAFDTAADFELFKQQFAPAPKESAKKLDTPKAAKSTTNEEWDMDPKELEKLLADAAAKAAEQTAKAVLEAQTKAAEEAKRKVAEEEALQAKIKAAVSAVAPAAPAVVQTVDTGAERLLSDIEKRLEDQANEHKSAIEGLESAIREKAKELEQLQNKSAELDALQRSRMQFVEPKDGDVPFAEKEKAVFISKITGKSMEETQYGREILQKYASGGTAGAVGSSGAGGKIRLPGANWETEVSLSMEDEMRRRLVVAGTIRQIAMSQPFMKIPVNPDTGHNATWVTNAQFATDTGVSSGDPRTHALKEIDLSSNKLATKEYIAFEEEEDGLIALVPIIRDAIVRRMAKTLDRAMLIGQDATAATDTYAGSGIKGLAAYDGAATASPTVAVGGALTVANVIAARKALGAWGLDPAELVAFVSTTAYYDLLTDSAFQTIDKVGPAAATLLTGQIGSIGNTPIVVTSQLTGTASNDPLMVLVNPRNFIVGNHRAMRMDTDDEVVNQRRVLVASLRIGMQQLSTFDGQAVVTVRYYSA
jgi:HK97 family phage prohead protease/HK97 family phage major capsid protein